MDTLTIDDLEVLRGKFAASEHEFTRGYAYITESAITTRLEQVDPAWRFELLNTAIRGDKVTVVARLTVKGVSRDGVGMQDILTGEKKDKGGNVIGIYETGEPEKGAATDALKRCARLFGVGRYLLDLPDHVKDERTLAAWLDAPVQASAQVDAATKAKLGSGGGERRIPPQESAGGLPVEVTVERFVTELSSNGKPYLAFNTARGKVSVFSRDDFRNAGYDVDAWAEVGEHVIEPPATMLIRKDGKFWKYVGLAANISNDTPLNTKDAWQAVYDYAKARNILHGKAMDMLAAACGLDESLFPAEDELEATGKLVTVGDAKAVLDGSAERKAG